MALADCHASSMAWVRMLPGRPAPPHRGGHGAKGTLIRLRKEKRYLVMPVCSERAGKARRATTHSADKQTSLALLQRKYNFA